MQKAEDTRLEADAYKFHQKSIDMYKKRRHIFYYTAIVESK